MILSFCVKLRRQEGAFGLVMKRKTEQPEDDDNYECTTVALLAHDVQRQLWIYDVELSIS